MKYNSNQPVQSRKFDAEDEGPFNRPNRLSYTKRSMPVTNLSFHIDEDVVEPVYYRDVIEEMEHLTELDTVQMRINSGGGSLGGLVSLLEAIRHTDASVMAIITGNCHSAASILALSCDQVMVSPFATMMVHNVSYGVAGKDADILGHVVHISDYSQKLVNQIYAGFLTEKEIQEVIDGKEFWFQSDEIQERLERKGKYMLKVEKAKQKASKSSKQPKESMPVNISMISE